MVIPVVDTGSTSLMDEVLMLRNEVARQLGIDIETIRFYENKNLISKPQRLENGYRSYTKENIVELKFIQHCRSLGIGIDEVRILRSMSNPSEDCSKANEIIEKNLKLIEQKIKQLKGLRRQLKVLADSCHSPGYTKDCEIVKTLVMAASGEDCACHQK